MRVCLSYIIFESNIKELRLYLEKFMLTNELRWVEKPVKINFYHTKKDCKNINLM